MVFSSVASVTAGLARPKERFADRIGEHVVEQKIQHSDHTGMSTACVVDWNLRHGTELKHHRSKPAKII
jgi:hypothetical protein